MKIKSYISTSSTQYSSNFLNAPPVNGDARSKTPKESTKQQNSQLKALGNAIKQYPLQMKKTEMASNSSKKITYPKKIQFFPDVEKNTYAFLHKGNRASQAYQVQRSSKSSIADRIITNFKTKKQFAIIKKLGQGKFGKVYIARQN